ncbi:MAG: type IV secretion protein IcmD [Proteobacteria bacterium]|nr:type IV secretion protein IcmD [Pseudomonadota bacterium]
MSKYLTKEVTQTSTVKPMLSLCMYFGVLLALYCISDFVLASSSGGSSGGDLGAVADNITGTMTSVAKLITAASYVAGIGFALMGMLKFKAHKDQPAQVPLSQPIVLLAIAAGLVFLPSLVTTAGSTVFGSGKTNATSKGGGVTGIEGS